VVIEIRVKYPRGELEFNVSDVSDIECRTDFDPFTTNFIFVGYRDKTR
jgi:hypothetical protein